MAIGGEQILAPNPLKRQNFSPQAANAPRPPQIVVMASPLLLATRPLSSPLRPYARRKEDFMIQKAATSV